MHQAGKLRYLLMLSLLPLTLSLAGCWDRWEIEDRGIIITTGVDLAQPTPAQGTEAQANAIAGHRPSYRLTMQILVPSQGEAGGGGGTGGGGGGMASVWNLSTTGPSISAAVRGAATRVYREPTFEHLEVIVLGEQLARQGISRPLDFFLREREARFRTSVFLAQGEALSVLEVKPFLQPINGLYLARLADNTKQTSRIGPELNLGDVERSLDNRQPMVLPRVVPAEGEVKLAGAGVLDKDTRLVGWLDELETVSLRFVLNLVKAASVPILLNGDVVNFEVAGNRTEAFPELRNGELSIRIRIQSEGALRENQSSADPLQKATLDKIQALAAQQIERQVTATVQRVQQDLGTDIFKFGRAVEKRFPAVWRQVKPDWDNIFPTLPVEVEAQVFVRRVGTVAGSSLHPSP